MNLLVATHKISVHERYFKLFIFFVVVDDHLVKIVVHEINVWVVVREDLFLSQDDFCFVLSIPKLIVINDISNFTYVCLIRGNNLYEVS